MWKSRCFVFHSPPTYLCFCYSTLKTRKHVGFYFKNFLHFCLQYFQHLRNHEYSAMINDKVVRRDGSLIFPTTTRFYINAHNVYFKRGQTFAIFFVSDANWFLVFVPVIRSREYVYRLVPLNPSSSSILVFLHPTTAVTNQAAQYWTNVSYNHQQRQSCES